MSENTIKRRYKIIPESDSLVELIGECTKSYNILYGNDYPMFSSKEKKEQIKEIRKSRHKENCEQLIYKFENLYPEFNDKFKLVSYGCVEQYTNYIVVEREYEIIIE